MKPQGSRSVNVPWVPIAVAVGVLLIVGLVVYLFIQSNQDDPPDNEAAQRIECNLDASGECVIPPEDPSPGLPGEWVDLPTAWAEGDVLAHYGEQGGLEAPNTNSHVSRDVDYTDVGLPPVGGPHWGQGRCGEDPADAAAFCGPVPWGIYREPWPAEALVHNMEHSGVVVWYNSDDTEVRGQLEDWVLDFDDSGKLVVLAPYPDIPADTVALTAWARRDVFPVSEMTEDRVKDFINKLACHFDPEGFC